MLVQDDPAVAAAFRAALNGASARVVVASRVQVTAAQGPG